MANINELNSIVQGLSDQQLQQQMQSPGQAPQYLILSEIQRRQKMRAEAQPPAPPATTTVKDDLLAAQQAQGVAGLPQMAEGEAAPENGVASFAGGGAVQPARGFPYSNYPSGSGEISIDFENSPLGKYLRRVKEQMANSVKMPDSTKGVFTNAPAPLKAIDAEVGRSQGVLLENAKDVHNIPNKLDKYVGDTQRFNLERWKEAGITPLDWLAEKKPPPVSDKYPEQSRVRNSHNLALPMDPEEQDVTQPAGVRRAGGGAGSVKASVAADGGIMSLPKGASEFDTPARNFDRIDDAKVHSPEEYMAMMEQYMPDRSGDLIARTDERIGKLGKEKDNQLNYALMQAGLGMMAAGAKNGSFLGAVGEGGIGGLQAYTKGMAGINDRADRLEGQRDQYMLAQDAAKAGRFKSAAEMADKTTNRNIQLRGQKVSERHHDMDYDQRTRGQDMQYQLGQDNINKSMEIAKMQTGAQLQAARIAAASREGIARLKGAGGAGGGGAANSKMMNAVKSQFNAQVSLLQKANPPMFGEDPTAYKNRLYSIALQGMSPEAQSIMGQLINVSPAQQAGPKRMVMGADGTIQ